MKKISFGSWAFVFPPYDSHPVGLEATARRVKEAGFDAIEICGVAGHATLESCATPQSRQTLKALLDELELERSGYLCDQRDCDPTEADNKQRYLDKFSQHLELCRDLGISDIRVDSVASPEKYRGAEKLRAAMGRTAEVFRAAAEAAKAAEIRMHWEFEPGFVFNKPTEIAALTEQVGHPNFLLQFDVSHAYACAAGVRHTDEPEILVGGTAELLDKIVDKIGSVHFADGDGTLYRGGTSLHLPPGAGRADLPLLAEKLSAVETPYWTIDLAFWPASWQILEASLAYARRLADRVAVAAD